MLQSVVVVLCVTAALLVGVNARNVVFFHPTVPSNLYVNAAQGPINIDRNEDQTNVIRLLLYPTDKKSREAKVATVLFVNGGANGTLTLTQSKPPMGNTVISGTITNLTPGFHGLSIHDLGDMQDACNNIGDVYNPYQLSVDWQPFNRFLGDLGYIEADSNGRAEVLIADPFVSLVGPRSVVGRSLAIRDHEGPVSNVLEQVSHQGSSCGVIGYAS